jgi:hypothetical protein
MAPPPAAAQPWPQPQPQVGPASVAAPVRPSSKAWIAIPIVLIVAAAAAAVAIFALRPSSSGGSSSATSTSPPPRSSGSALPSSSVAYFVDASSVPKQLRDKVPHARISTMAILRSQVTAEIEEPGRKGHFDHYEINSGVLSGGNEVDHPWNKDHPFDLDAIHFEAIPAMVKDAPARVGSSQGEVQSIVLGMSHGNAPTFMVAVMTPARDTKSVYYDLTGKFLSANN